MNTEQNQIPNAAAASPGLSPAVARHVGRPDGRNVVEALSRTSAKGDLTMLRVRMVHVFATFLLLASIVALGGCSKKEEAAVAPPQPQPAAQPAPQPAPAPSSNALPSTQGEIPGLTLTIQELKRSSSALTLKFVLQSKGGFQIQNSFGEGGGGFGTISGIHLIDAANKKKYFVMLDTAGACVCSSDIAYIAAGSQSLLWAKFPAPPDDVQKITVEIPHFPPFEDVAISH
jgi:hypothetical protein